MSFVPVDTNSDFPIENLPFGVFQRKNSTEEPRIGIAIGDEILDLKFLHKSSILSGSSQNSHLYNSLDQTTLNDFMSHGRPFWKEIRSTVSRLLSQQEGVLRDDKSLQSRALVHQSDVNMLLPATIGDYTDFYASKEHASNVGSIMRGKDNALMPNWVWIPIGYHGRASSIVPNGTAIRRPRGQIRPNENEPPIYAPSRVVDFELEMAFFVGPGNPLGDPISISKADDHIFGVVLMNDWSARDIQRWEYLPLGPFCAKNWATTISPWIVTMEALEPFRTAQLERNPPPLPYLADDSLSSYDIQLTVGIQSEKMDSTHIICRSNLKYMYWTMKQMLVHHTSTGCNLRTGDLLGTGTISGPDPDSLGSLLEITWGGSKPFKLPTGEERKYLQDGDTVILEGFGKGNGFRVGFGKCSGKLLPAHTS